MQHALTVAAGAMALAACAAVPPDDVEPPAREPTDSCRSEPGQRFIGQRASAETGAAILAATGATRIRWVPPNTAVTMEYAYGRVTVGYDNNYRITQVSCG